MPPQKRTRKNMTYPGGLVAACALVSLPVFIFVMLNQPLLLPWYNPLALLLWFWLFHLIAHVFGLLAIVLRWPPFPQLLRALNLEKVYRKQIFLVWYLFLTLYVGSYVLYESAWAVYWIVG